MKAIQIDVYVSENKGTYVAHSQIHEGIEVVSNQGLHIGLGNPTDSSGYFWFPLDGNVAKNLVFEKQEDREIPYIKECDIAYSFEFDCLAVQLPIALKNGTSRILVKLNVFSGKRGDVEPTKSSFINETQVLAETKYKYSYEGDVITLYSVLMEMNLPSPEIKSGDFYMVTLTGFVDKLPFIVNAIVLFDSIKKQLQVVIK